MADYTPREIVNIIKILGECRDNHKAAERLYALRYPNARHPDRKTIRDVTRRAEQGYMVRKRRKTGPRELIVLGVRAIVAENPHISTREIQRIHGVPKSTVNRVLRHSQFHPYHIKLTQALEAGDYGRRLNFSRWAENQLRREPFFFDRVLFVDEAKFDNMGGVNLHNCHYYSDENPHWQRNHRPQRRWALNVWAGIVGDHLVGPIFYERNLNGQLYLDILQNQVPPLLEDVPLNIRRDMWFQQDGATPHRTRPVTRFLNTTYRRRWIGIGSQVREWPPRSPDLTPLDFFLWGAVKGKVDTEAPTTIEDMRERIIQAFQGITVQTLRDVQANFRHRIQICINEDGHPIEHLMH